MTEESEICTFIVESQVPSLQAFGALNIKMTPAIAAALTTKMSPRELQNFTQMLKKKGLLEDKAFKDAVKKKMTKAAKSGNLSMRGTAAKKVLGKDADIMSDATDDFVASLPMIKKKVALFIDKSSSMSTAITQHFQKTAERVDRLRPKASLQQFQEIVAAPILPRVQGVICL